MDKLKLIAGPAPRQTVAGVPEGFDALVLAGLARSEAVLHVVRDEARARTLTSALNFLARDIEVVGLPAWDCLPYDRVSPSPDIVSGRLETLSRLARLPAGAKGVVVIVPVDTLLQRVVPREAIRKATYRLTPGDRVDLDALTVFLARNGYTRTGTVREAGEYAVRGGIIDVAPPGQVEPARLDLFGDTLETVRTFDPLTQRTTGTLTGLDLLPASEVPFDPDSVRRFRGRYQELFGAVADDDPLYEAVSGGRRHAGVEHWLPLFYEGLDTVFDYVPGLMVILDPQVEESAHARLALIQDYYAARVEQRQTRTAGAGTVYKPVPPEQLYIREPELQRLLGARRVRQFQPFGPSEPKAIDMDGRPGREFAAERAQGQAEGRAQVNVFDVAAGHITRLQDAGRRTVVACTSTGARDRLATVMHDHAIPGVVRADSWREVQRLDPRNVALVVLPLERGFEAPDLAVISEQDLLGDRLVRQAKRSRRAENFLTEATALTPGDLVVHVEHGIGRFDGLQTISVQGALHDFLQIMYDENARLLVPVENIEVLSRYGSAESGGQLDKLGGVAWQTRKAKLKKRIRDMAAELIKVAAARAVRTTDAVEVARGMYDEFAARFPYPETDDQIAAIADVMGDLSSGKPMDRLICGDVGFGKTEVAMRAAFITAMSGRQVAIVTPTTLLCRQHFRTFSARFQGLPVRIGQLSRLVGPKDQKAVKKELGEGQLDIVVGTHALLGKGIDFKNLGLVIVDEEQHFGVAHKERLKQLRAEVHVLTLTATPIPRTLQLAMTGVRDLSLIATPPVDRLAVRTHVLPFDPLVLREAILREHYRGGQSFYVVPRIADLDEAAEFLAREVPEVKVIRAHGQMPPGQLDDVMNAFYDGKYEVLLSTTIVESGLDIPTANTLIIHRADMFGLAQLYQLRGRVGRSKARGYAYFTVPPRKVLTATAERRLEVLQSLDELGAGFTLASHDLDIRGAGNLLGEEQSGHVREVGIELYQEMLEEAMAAARAAAGAANAAPEKDEWSPNIAIGASVLIPEDYVADLEVRLGLYRRIADLADRSQIDGFAAELIDRFGPLPQEVEHLLKVVEIKALARRANIEKMDAGPKGATVVFRKADFPNPAGLVQFIGQSRGQVKIRPDNKLVCLKDWERVEQRLDGALWLADTLAKLAA
ncbi:transcription-repair coupling factor [Zavarzinia sp. CC-PAN008]|uniref:transcription-repair coupling factor n=1 Tax=Zavarzinia sp. CC-PAN008 TaxID=3243332 RepID=UPI003F744608